MWQFIWICFGWLGYLLGWVYDVGYFGYRFLFHPVLAILVMRRLDQDRKWAKFWLRFSATVGFVGLAMTIVLWQSEGTFWIFCVKYLGIGAYLKSGLTAVIIMHFHPRKRKARSRNILEISAR